jgi:hypothetical protein
MESPISKARFFQSLLTNYRKLCASLKPGDIATLFQTETISVTDCQLSWAAEMEALKCASADDIFDLFAHSDRILKDLEAEIGFTSPDLVFVLREWEERASPHLEFRGFVTNNQLRAVSQYDFRFAYDDILKHKEQILEHIQRYFASRVQPRFDGNNLYEGGNYSVDFLVILGESGVQDIKVIEMNRFDVTTGGSLFDWDEDRDVLFGRKPFEFRVVQPWAMKPKDFHYWLVGDFAELKEQCHRAILTESTEE